jgi:hypothetical protein
MSHASPDLEQSREMHQYGYRLQTAFLNFDATAGQVQEESTTVVFNQPVRPATP